MRSAAGIGVLAVLAGGLFVLAPAPGLAAPRAKSAGSAAAKIDAAAGAAIRARIAALVLRRVAFGSISLLPVRFAESRIAGPFEDGGRTLYCVGTQMHGRSFGKPERPRALVRLDRRGEGGVLTADEYDPDLCAGHRTEPFPELEAAGNRRS